MNESPAPPPPVSRRMAWSETIVTLLAFSVPLVLLIRSILALNGGHFVYMLDDPYIHLAVGEEIARGNYGVNPHEFASPASSVLWPLLMAPFALTKFGALVPLVLNIAFSIAIILLVLRRLRTVIPSGNLVASAGRVFATLTVLVAANIYGLVFFGMEHCLQTLAALAVVDGVVAISRDERLPPWFPIALAVGPLIRYENAALTVIGCSLLWYSGRRKAMIVPAAVAAGGLILFSLFLLVEGQNLLPASVLAKTGEKNGIDLILVFLSAILFIHAGTRRFSGIVAVASLGLSMAGFAHLLVGGTAAFHRYHAYILGALVFAAACLPIGAIYRILGRLTTLAVLPVVLLTISELWLPYPREASQIPAASNNIYGQQYQMHRFLTGWWKRPAAVNDLGWTSFRNEQPILDLWGLASLDALRARQSWHGSEWMGEIARKRNVGLVIIYSQWFESLPSEWTKVAQLNLGGPLVSCGRTHVEFYAITGEAHEILPDMLREFSATLPKGVTLEIGDTLLPCSITSPIIAERHQGDGG